MKAPRSLSKSQTIRLRRIISKAPWKKATSPAYRDAPHSYIIFFWNAATWKWFAGLIREHGEYRTWRGHRYKYLIVGRECFWIDWPALNRAKESTLDPL